MMIRAAGGPGLISPIDFGERKKPIPRWMLGAIGVSVVLLMFFPAIWALKSMLDMWGIDPGAPSMVDGQEIFPGVPIAVGVNPALPAKTLKEFIALAKKERLLYGSPGVGNGLHLATEIFAKKAGIKLQHVPYKGASEVMTALLGGSINVMFVTPPSVMGLIKEGRVRPLAFTGTKPFAQAPEVPLMKDLVPGYESQGSWGMMLGPGTLPDDLTNKLNAAVRKALLVPQVASIMQRDGYIPDNRDAAATAAFFRKEVMQAEEAVKAAGIEPN